MLKTKFADELSDTFLIFSSSKKILDTASASCQFQEDCVFSNYDVNAS